MRNPFRFIPLREAEAVEEIGHTDVPRMWAVVLGLIFLLTIGWLPVVDTATRWAKGSGSLVVDLMGRVRQVLQDLPREGLVVANRALKQHLDQFETTLETESWLRHHWVPVLRSRMVSDLGLGGDQVFIGREGSLYYRADVDHLVGRGFLLSRSQRRRAQGGDLWAPAPQPDPQPAIAELIEVLDDHGIVTLVLPTPVKPTVDPEDLIEAAWIGHGSTAASVTSPVENASFPEFVESLIAAGVEVMDPAPLLVAAKLDSGVPQYLRTDTHWTPQALERVARALADRIEALKPGLGTKRSYRRQVVVLEGLGDTAGMLGISDSQNRIPADRIEADWVLTVDGKPWRAESGAEILLVGDSFSNVFSDAGLGWGTSAGLAEQLSYFLSRPVDKIAVNAGGARAARAALYRAMDQEPQRFARTRVVIYQFATRELSQGDWRIGTVAGASQGRVP